MRNLKEVEEVSGCTFQPKIIASKIPVPLYQQMRPISALDSSDHQGIAVHERLYGRKNSANAV